MNTKLDNEIGNRLRHWRKSVLGMTQEQFAQRTGIHLSAIRKYESRSSLPSGESLLAIAGTGINLHWLLTGGGDAPARAEGCKPSGDPSAAEACPFCLLPPARIIAADEWAFVVRDAFPVSLGHALIIPRRHVGSFFGVTPRERESLLHLLEQAKVVLDHEFHPAGYNIGINDGSSAGQTVPHLHIHLIPRYTGDLPDPRGGVRWVIPEKAKYWK